MLVKVCVAIVVRAAAAEFYPFQRLLGSGRSLSKPCSSGAVRVGSRCIAVDWARDLGRRQAAESSVQGYWRRTPGQMARHG